MSLQILITHTDEEEWVLKRLLNSIASQYNANMREFSVIIGNNQKDCIPSRNLLNNYEYNIINLTFDAKTIYELRNCLLDAATADYVFIINASDILYCNCVLRDILNLLDIHKPCIVDTPIHVDTLVNEQQINQTIICSVNNASIYGRIYNTAFLNENNIRFINDDMSFINIAVQQAKLNNQQIINSDFLFYKYTIKGLIL